MPDLLKRLLLAGLILILLALPTADYLRFRDTPLHLSHVQIQQVDNGWSQQSLINHWKQQGFLVNAQRDPLWLRLQQRLAGGARTIKAGEYELRPGDTLLDALARIQAGDTLRYSFTIVEGWTFKDLRQALAKDERLQPKTASWTATAIMDAVDKSGVAPEGQFLPETYQFVRDSSDLMIYQQASRSLNQALQSAWLERQADLPLDNPQQALVLASIVEKETAVASERPLIAGVFINRLRKGMRLQTDPTVIYGLGERFDGNLRRKDLRSDTPFNTYTRSGLPPTPIALPGRAAINASLQPDSTDKFYFVATGQGGNHYFSSTLSEHQAAVRRYQLNK